MLYRDGDVPSSLWEKENSRVIEGLCGDAQPKPCHFYRFKRAEPAEALVKAGEKR
jgi:hypothetical protein